MLIDRGEIFIQPTLKQCDIKVLCVRNMLCSSVVSVCVRETDHLPEQKGNKQKIQPKKTTAIDSDLTIIVVFRDAD